MRRISIPDLERSAQAYHNAARVEREAQEYVKEMLEMEMTEEEVRETQIYKNYVKAVSGWRRVASLWRWLVEAREDTPAPPGTPEAE